MTVKIAGCGAVYVAVIAAFGGVRSAGDRVGAAGRRCSPAPPWPRSVTAFTAGVRRRGHGVHRAVPAGAHPDDAVLRHVLPGRPAARRGCSRSRGSRRCGTAPSWPAPPRSARARRWAALPALGHVAFLRGAGRRRLGGGASRASGGGCTGDVREVPRPVRSAAPRRRCRCSPGCCRPAATPGRSSALVRRSATASRRTWLAFVSGFFEPVFYLVAMGQGLGALVGTLPGPDGQPDPLRRLHRAGAAGRVGDERRGVRLHVQRVLQAQVQPPLRRGAGHAARAGRHRARRDRLGADPRRAVRAGVPRGDGRLRPAALAVGAAGAARGARRGVRASRPSAWRPPPTCARGRTSTSSRSRSCRCSCSPPRSTRCRSTRGGCSSSSRPCRCSTPSS